MRSSYKGMLGMMNECVCVHVKRVGNSRVSFAFNAPPRTAACYKRKFITHIFLCPFVNAEIFFV